MIRTREDKHLILEFKKYFYYDSHTRSAKYWNLNPFLNTKEMLDVKDKVFKYLDDPDATWKYLILTNMQKWYFYSRSDLTTKRKLKPFAEKTVRDVFDRFGNEFTESEVERLEFEEKRSWRRVLRRSYLMDRNATECKSGRLQQIADLQKMKM